MNLSQETPLKTEFIKMYIFWFIISFFWIWLTFLIYTPWHKWLRNNTFFNICFAFSILILIWDNLLIKFEFEAYSIYTLSYLSCFKIANIFMLRKYKRNLIISPKSSINYLVNEPEKEHETWIDVFLGSIPFILMWLINSFFLK
jgi:magnesium-transporting ATPase (P-type)